MIVRLLTRRGIINSYLYGRLKKPLVSQDMARPSSGILSFCLCYILSSHAQAKFPYWHFVICLCVSVWVLSRPGSIQEDFFWGKEYSLHHWSRGQCREWSPHLQRSRRLLEKMGSTGMLLQKNQCAPPTGNSQCLFRWRVMSKKTPLNVYIRPAFRNSLHFFVFFSQTWWQTNHSSQTFRLSLLQLFSPTYAVTEEGWAETFGCCGLFVIMFEKRKQRNEDCSGCGP